MYPCEDKGHPLPPLSHEQGVPAHQGTQAVEAWSAWLVKAFVEAGGSLGGSGAQVLQTLNPDPNFKPQTPDPNFKPQIPDPNFKPQTPDPNFKSQTPKPYFKSQTPDPKLETIKWV